MRIVGKSYDEERVLYNLKDSRVVNCKFGGPKDGESALKESRNVVLDNCKFSMRYPLWHSNKFSLLNSSFDVNTRAPIWYAKEGKIDNCKLDGVKMLRECKNIKISNTKINSIEFSWRCKDVDVKKSSIVTEYGFFESSNVHLNNVNFKGKYSFQYNKNLVIENSTLTTKDAFWHAKNVTVKNSTIIGEYLGWFSDGLTLINCKIKGIQPLCYCKNLKLVNCTMEGCNLAFEYSDVDATIKGYVKSIKNVKSGTIKVDRVGKVIKEDSIMKLEGKIITK